MTTLSNAMHFVRVRDNRKQIAAVARTLSQSFSADPLVKWLRPNATPWHRDGAEQAWQRRRILKALYEGMVYSSTKIDKGTPPAMRSSEVKSVAVLCEESGEDQDAGVAIMLFPPRKGFELSLRRIWGSCKLWFLDSFDPVYESGSNEDRVNHLIATHDAAMERLGNRIGSEKIWYLEVVAVHPALQGCGYGRKAIEWVLDCVGGDPVVLECTAASNVVFYERLGFQCVEKVDLQDEGEKCELWIMLAQGTARW